MIENQDIVILGLMRFDGPYESANFTMAKLLAKQNRVFYIDNPYTWKDYLSLRNTEEFKKRKKYLPLSSSGVIPTDLPDIHIVVPPIVPSINVIPEGFIYRNLLKLSERLIAKRIKKIIRDYSIKDFIYINSFNFHYPDVAKLIKPTLTVYQCVDPLIRSFDTKHGIISEASIVKTSNLIICTSKQLYEEKKKLNPNTFFIANAADIKHSSKALDSNLPIHPAIKSLRKPVIGYFGNIERRIDFDLLKQVAQMNPDKSFAFVGPQEIEFIPDWFFATPNIHLTGKMPYEQMPLIIKGFDVAIIPFKADEVSKTIFPLKLFEYLGAGKPVVAINFNPDLKDFTDGTVAFCDDANEFSREISNALLNDSTENLERRVKVATANTWDERMKEISTLLLSNLKEKKPDL